MATIGAPVKKRRSYAEDNQLQSYELPSYDTGYNSYNQTRSQAKDTDVTGGQDSRPAENGAFEKRAGKAVASPVLQSGYAVAAMGLFKKSGVFTKLALCGNKAYSYTDTTSSELTGATFTPTNPENCRIFQAIGRSYFVNGIDQPYYTTNGTSLTLQSGAFPMKFGSFYNQRVYCVRPEYPDRIYYSNPLSVDITTTGTEPSGYSAGNFGTFSVNLSLTPIQNAGFIILMPDSGVVITSIIQDKGTSGIDSIFVHTLEHGIWELTAQAALNTNGTVSHSVKQIIRSGGCPAPLSVFASGNDQKFYGGDNMYKLAEVANFQSLRTDPESGKVESDMRTVPASLKRSVVGIEFDNADYIFYANGSYNDRTLVYDKILKAWSTPYRGWKVSCAFVYKENDGRTRLLAGSADPADSRIYELEVGDSDAGTVISSSFRDKNTSCGHKGRLKRFSHTNVFYSQIVGSLTVDVYIDGVLVDSKSVGALVSNTRAVGVGSQKVGSFQVGRDAVGAASTQAVLTDSYFTIDHDYAEGDKMELVYSNSVTGQQYRILGRETFFELGDETEGLKII